MRVTGTPPSGALGNLQSVQLNVPIWIAQGQARGEPAGIIIRVSTIVQNNYKARDDARVCVGGSWKDPKGYSVTVTSECLVRVLSNSKCMGRSCRGPKGCKC